MRKEFCRWVRWVRMVRACGNRVKSSEGLEEGGEVLKSPLQRVGGWSTRLIQQYRGCCWAE